MSLQISSPVVYSNWTGPTLAWRPTALGAGLNLWLKANSGLTLSSAGRASALLDQSSNAYTLGQTASGSQLLYTASAQNGLPGLSNDTYGTTLRDLKSAAYLPAVGYEYNQPFSISFAFVYGGGVRNSYNYLFGHYETATGAAGYRGIIVSIGSSSGVANTIGIRLQNTTAAAIQVSGSTVLVAGKCYCCTITYDGSGLAAGLKLYVNGIVAETKTVQKDLLASGTIVSTTATTLFVIGGDVLADSTPDTFLECFYSNAVYSAANLAGSMQYLDYEYAAY
jgi:hypothetical protein